jgi:hypothetical protein
MGFSLNSENSLKKKRSSRGKEVATVADALARWGKLFACNLWEIDLVATGGISGKGQRYFNSIFPFSRKSWLFRRMGKCIKVSPSPCGRMKEGFWRLRCRRVNKRPSQQKEEDVEEKEEELNHSANVPSRVPIRGNLPHSSPNLAIFPRSSFLQFSPFVLEKHLGQIILA